MTLHTVNKPQILTQCLKSTQKNDSILLFEDGVYAALSGGFSDSSSITVPVFVLEEDLNARGLAQQTLTPGITRVTYSDFVKLTEQHKNFCAWY